MRTSLRIVIVILAHSSCSNGAIWRPPMKGGFSELAASDPAVGPVMNFIASEVNRNMFQGDSCLGFRVDGTPKVERKVVQGTIYTVTASLTSTCLKGPLALPIVKCREVEVFEPLPYRCKSTDAGNPNPMEMGDVSEKCSSSSNGAVMPEMIGGCAGTRWGCGGGAREPMMSGGYSDAMEDPNLTDVLDFAKREVELEYGIDIVNCDSEVDPRKAESQVVAGTNYRIGFRMTSTCLGGDLQIDVGCEDITVHKPFDTACQNDSDESRMIWQDPKTINPKCLVMSRGPRENCRLSLGFNRVG